MQDGKERKYIDLHIHSTYSDGSFTVKEIVEYASAKNLKAISLTDHDCVAGIEAITGFADKIGIEVVPGVEMSSLYENCDVHILGYSMDISDNYLNKYLNGIRELRIERAKAIVELLNKKGVELQFERVLNFSKGFSIGRPHIAAALISEEHVGSFSEAFDKYLGNHTEFFIPVNKLPPKEVISVIKNSGGVAIMAHPFVTGKDEIIEQLIDDGLDGLEVFHPRQPYKIQKKYKEICHKFNLLETGGSDCHGSQYGRIVIGNMKVPYEFIENLKAKIRF